MFELERSGFPAVRPLFCKLSLLHGSVGAVFSDPDIGQIWVDDLASPRRAVLHGPEGTYLAGDPHGASSDLREAVADWNYVYPDASWLPVIHDVLPNRYMVVHERVRLALKARSPSSIVLSRGLKLVDGEHPLATSLQNPDKVICRCTVDMVVDDYVEFGVWTDPAYRGQGLARVAARASINRAIDARIETFGWHCHASNTRSIKVAKSLGFVVTDRYLAFSASLPAENDGDLDTAECLELAAHFEAGASKMPWLDFHAAAGWVLAGYDDRALDAVERLVSRGWNGKAEWLEDHWALSKLGANSRFQAAIQALNKTR